MEVLSWANGAQRAFRRRMLSICVLMRRAEAGQLRWRARAHERDYVCDAEQRTVPQIFIGDHHVGGFDDLYALDRAGKLDALTGRA